MSSSKSDSMITKIRESVSAISEDRWLLGDQLIELNKGKERGYSPIHHFCERGDIEMSEASARLIMRTAAAFRPAQRRKDLSWEMYCYAVSRTSTPQAWMAAAVSNHWNYTQLRAAVQASGRAKPIEDRLAEPEKILSINVRPGTTVSVYVSMGAESDPLVKVVQKDQLYSVEAALSLTEAINECVAQINEYLGV